MPYFAFKSVPVKSILVSALSCLLFLASCKKETVAGLTGSWMNAEVYSDSYGWKPVHRFHEFLRFDNNARFTFFTDVPGSSGTYAFDGPNRILHLHFDASQWGDSARSERRTIELITDDRLVISFVSPADGVTYKTAYVRVTDDAP